MNGGTMIKKAFVLSILSIYAFVMLPLAPVLAQNLTLPGDTEITEPGLRQDPPSEAVPLGGPLKVADEAIVDIPTTEEFALKTESPASRPWYKKWWVWTIAGAVVTGVVIAVAGAGDDGGGPRTGSASVTEPLP